MWAEVVVNADVEYHFLQSLIEMHAGEYFRGDQGAVARLAPLHRAEPEAVRRAVRKNPSADKVIQELQR